MSPLPFRDGELALRCHSEPMDADDGRGGLVTLSICDWCQAGGRCPDALVGVPPFAQGGFIGPDDAPRISE